MLNEPLVSVVIATYNMSEYLPLAVRSALDQTYKNIEVLIVDDGSTDDTRKVVQPLLDDPRVRYLFQENKGQAAAKNHGIRESGGDYVAFLDADDMWAPNKLDLQVPLFTLAENVGVVYSRIAYIDQNGEALGISPDALFRGKLTGALLIHNFVGFGTSVVKKACFDQLGGFKEDLRMGIDYDLWLRFSTKYDFDYVDQPLLYYRLWSGQMSNNCKGRYLNGIAIMESFLREFPGVVDKETENEAWAHTYVGFGYCLKNADERIGAALSLYLRAIRHKPTYFPAWKAIFKSILLV